jgi:hypothetical protein
VRAAAVALAVLAAASGGTAFAAPSPSPSDSISDPDANLFVYRDAAQPAGCLAELFLDGRRFAVLAQHSYTSLAVRPGIHQLQFRWAADCGHGDVTNQVEVEDRRLYYFALAGDTKVTSAQGAGAYALNLHETTSLVPVDPDEGVQTVAACCRFTPSDGRF